jgi:hypothetical protein
MTAGMLIRRCLIAMLPILIAHGHAGAQVNIEQYRAGVEETGYAGRISAAVSTRSGNVDVTTLDLEHRSDLVGDGIRTFLVARGEYGWQGGSSYSNEMLAHVRHIRGTDGRVRAETFIQTDYNLKRLLTSRVIAGAGVRIGIMGGTGDTGGNGGTLWFGTAIMGEHEVYDLPPGAVHSDEETVGRWSNYLTGRLALGAHADIALTGYIQPRLDAMDDLRVLNESALTVKAAGGLSVTVTFRLRYDSDPPDGVEDMDTTLKTGITLTF